MPEPRNKMDKKLTFFLLLPFILWPLTFIILRQFFWVLMPISTTLLGATSLLSYREKITWGRTVNALIFGLISSVILYGVFWVGDKGTILMGLDSYVDEVYELVYTSPNTLVLAVGLIWIGIMEEIYWRGSLLGILKAKNRKFPILEMSLIYSVVHVVTFNPILVFSAFLVGLILGLTAEKEGIIASTIGHVIWLELILILIPVR